METLEELKAIVDKAESGGYTLTSLCGSNFYRLEGSDWIGFDADESEFIEYEMPATRAVSDIKRIIELMEQIAKVDDVKEECQHKYCIVHWDHHQCKSCGYVLTDGGFGCASNKWFPNIEAAKFYQKNGFLPS